MTLFFVYITLALAASFLCSILEAIMLTVTHAHIEILKKRKVAAGFILEKLKDKIDQPLAAILTLNTISHTAAATIVGAEVHKRHGDEYTAVASAILTIIILVFTEIVPKTIGSYYWKTLSVPCAYICNLLVKILYPFVLMSKSISRIFGAKHSNQQRITREEMLAHVEIGETEGILQKKETLIIKNLLRLNSIYVKDIMTPRSVLVAFPKDQTIQEVINEYKSVPFSRIPIFEKDIDHVIGMIFRFEFLEHFGNDQMTMKLEEFSHPIHTIHQNQSVALTLDEFIKRREHMFLAVDDYGTTMGIVTLEDTVETLLGVEIMDETDDVADMRKFALERWEKRQLEIEQHKKVLHKKS